MHMHIRTWPVNAHDQCSIVSCSKTHISTGVKLFETWMHHLWNININGHSWLQFNRLAKYEESTRTHTHTPYNRCGNQFFELLHLVIFIHFYKLTGHKKISLSFFFFVTLIKLNVLLLQHKVICFALSFMETLGQGGAGTCKSIDFLWHKPTAPCQNNEFLSTPQPPRENVILHAIRAWSVCGQWWGEGSLHLSPRRVGTIFSWAPACYSSTRERTPWINTDGSECGVARK